ncbi:helix-turn-helix domain-containing protein, partial [Pseudonocardia asaccharolytica]
MDNTWAGSGQLAANRGRQRELYGAPLGDRIRRLTRALGITQSRLARTLGLSPAMLSQLVSGRRVKIGDPAVLARLMLLDERCPVADPPPGPDAVERLLAEIRDARLHWAGGGPQPAASPAAPTDPAPPRGPDDQPRSAGRRP